MRSLLLGPVLGIVAHQRGLFPLHASCVRIGDGAYAIAGPSGVGKSTLAASLARRGAGVLANDFSIIDLAAPERPVIRPASAALTLWHDAAEALDIITTSRQIGRPGQSKYMHFFGARDHEDGDAVPLRGVLFPAMALPKQPDRIYRLPADKATRLLFKNIYRSRIGRFLNRHPALFHGAGRIAETVPTFQIERQLDLSALDGLAALVYAELF